MRSDVDTPERLYCKLPQDSPIGVRGARNFHVRGSARRSGHPPWRSGQSDRQFEPLAMRQHVTGPYPIDPNLIAQGVPVDDRITFQDQIFGPVGGNADAAPPHPHPRCHLPHRLPAGGALPAAAERASSLMPLGRRWPSPPTIPQTRRTPHPTAMSYSQTNLVAPAHSWEDLMPK